MSAVVKASELDLERRKVLVAATSAMGGAGLLITAVPFLETLSPSAAARAAGAPAQVDLSALAPGSMTTVEWRGKPVWILHRSPDMLAHLQDHDALLADPDSRHSEQPPYAANLRRSIKPEFFVALGLCTHLGCIPSLRPGSGGGDLGADWPGGFYCPCHGSKFDLAGRVFRNVPAPTNLVIPPHQFLGELQLEIGRDALTA